MCTGSSPVSVSRSRKSSSRGRQASPDSVTSRSPPWSNPRRASSYAQEDLSPVHPVENQPEDEEHRGAAKDGLEWWTEHEEGTVAKMPHERRGDEVLDRPAHHVHRDGVHSDHEEGKTPSAPSAYVDHCVER